MSDTSTSFNRPFKPFGLNVKVPDRTLKQINDSLKKTASDTVSPLFQYLEKNENVFSGDINMEIKKLNASAFTTGSLMQQEDENTNGKSGSSFDMHF